jgi:putative two-component system response regulator
MGAIEVPDLATPVTRKYRDVESWLPSASSVPRSCSKPLRLAGLAARLGIRLGLGSDEREAIEYGAVLHDVGRIGIPEAILGKRGPLTPDEWAILRRHPEIGAEICRPSGCRGRSCRSFDTITTAGTGPATPDQLRGDQIPLGARVVGLVDAFDAMTPDRPY